MQKNTGKYLYWTLGGTVLVLFGAGLIAFRNLDKLMSSSRLVEHTHGVVFKAEEVYSLMKDAETGARGYILTHDSRFLEPYFQGTTLVGPAMVALDSMSCENMVQSQRVDSLRLLIDERFQIMSRSISLSLQAPDQDTLLQSLLRGKEVMDKIRVVLTKIKREEQRLLVEQEAEKSRFYALTPIWLGVISGLAVLVFVLTYAKVVFEIRRRWQDEARLEKTVAALKRSNEDLEQFAYVASHHLQEPLRKLRMFSDRLFAKHRPELSKEAAFLMERMEHSAIEMQTLIEDLLIFSQFGKISGDQSFSPVSLREVLDAVLDEHAVTLRDKGAKVDIEENLPVIWGNPTQLLRLFSNLMENSLKFVHNNEIPLVSITSTIVQGIELSGTKKKDKTKAFCKISFADHGIGFDEAFKDKIFQLFQRLQNKKEFKGTGVGLAICKKVVANHNGYLDVQSRPNGGTTFIICLPLANQ